MDSTTINRLNDLLEYVRHLGKSHQKPIFKIEEYKQLTIWEHELKGKISIYHDLTDEDGGSIWLKIDRLKRISSPPMPEQIQEWITVGNDPDSPPHVKEKLFKTLPESEVRKLIDDGIIVESDVTDPLKEQISEIKEKDVIFRIENNQHIKTKSYNYFTERWLPWSEKEKLRRVTIGIYDSLFSLQQSIESQGDEQPIELIWGIGIARWSCKGHQINHPLLEKPIEIEVDPKDGAILIHPRNNDPNIVVSTFAALGNPGVEILLRFCKNYFSDMSDDVEFSPYIHESFEPLLRNAVTRLSNSGVYWPDINPDRENRVPNHISESLEITDSWVIFARPRSTTGFVQDVERFKKKLGELEDNDIDIPNPTIKLVTELSDEMPLQTGNGFLTNGVSVAGKQKSELFFPKPFNASQVQIVDRLEQNDGVVVQGPPGTGKTHTIANIICHYLATGRSVLVTSKGEPALSVLQEQIPEELRNLTISLLTNERQGMKQLETAVQSLANLVSQTNQSELEQDIKPNELRVKQLKKEIVEIDTKVKEWGQKQLSTVRKEFAGASSNMTAMELAQQVMDDSDTHDWFLDELGSSEKYKPQFTDSDIAKLKNARRNVGENIIYVGKNFPKVQDMPDSANIAAIHNDISTSAQISKKLKKSNIPPLAVSVDDSVNRAKQLIKPLKDLTKLLELLENRHWIKPIFYSWIEESEDNNDNIKLFNELLSELSRLMEQRQIFVATLVEIPNPSSCFTDVNTALNNLVNGKRPFSIFPFGNKESKQIIDQSRIEGEIPKEIKEWKIILDYINFQNDIRKFIIKWNHVGQELALPEFTYRYSSLFKKIQSAQRLIIKTQRVADNWESLKQEIIELFPHGIDVSIIVKSRTEIDKTVQAIELNTSSISLGAQRTQLQDLMKKIEQSDGKISKKIRRFIEKDIGNPNNSSDQIIQAWNRFNAELTRLKMIMNDLQDIESISDKVSTSGALIWAKRIKSEPFLMAEDALTPIDWYETWKWKQRKQYLYEIDGREQLKKLSIRKSGLDNDLKRTFSKLIRLKTNIGLHKNMNERVQGALMHFVVSIARIGRGTGVRALRYRKDAYRAMQDCYSGVPCWIMPTWRVSESLPSDFGSFDLVIIDEASQSDITALPAILRAKKILIVGDDKQVSPTDAFFAEKKILQLQHNFLVGQPFASLLLPGGSIYDLANTVFPSQRIMLTEHFRCVEPIIRFSMQFYNEDLIPLRIPKSSEKLTPPLIDVVVKGGQRDERKKTNELEAEAIISEIQILVSDPKYNGRSIGVVSLIGAQQAKYIQDQLLNVLGKDIYQNYQIACGDSATFQGKERDIMFLSMVVGSGQGVAMTTRGFEQRMNVALSRARDRMYLYRSIHESELNNESDLRLKILRHFSSPMPQYEQVDDLIDLCESDFERDVYKKLIGKGYNVIPQVKVGKFSIDLVVEGENDRRLAIELDGDKYHPPEKWMEDWHRQRTMERVGWQFWRCWGSSYTIDPEGCIDDLINLLNNMQIFPCEIKSNTNIYTEQRIYEVKIEEEPENPSNKLINWTVKDEDLQNLSAVRIYKGKILTRESHRVALIQRLQTQIDQAENPQEEVERLEQALMDSGILAGHSYRSRGWEAYELLDGNPMFEDYLGLLEYQELIPGKKITENNEQAEKILDEEKGLGVWPVLEALGI